MAQLAMFSRQLDVSEAVDRIAACSRVLFTEDFAGGLEHLRRDLGLPLESRRERVTVQRSSLEPGQVERLRARLEPEYDLLRRLAAGGISMPGQKG